MTFNSVRKFVTENKWLILGYLALILISVLYLNRLFAFQFVDEEDNLVLGHFLLQNQKLYSELFSHHQPFAYIISALIQFITKPEDIYQLIYGHRIFVIGWALIWGCGLIWRFREKIIFPLLVNEFIKFYLLGNLFLAESLIIYPVLYLVLFLFNAKLNKKVLEYGLIGFLISFSGLLLAPLWPFLLLYFLFLLWTQKPSKKQIIYLMIGAIISLIIVLPFLDIYYYFRNVFYINFKYYIPQSAEEKMPWALIKSFFSPFILLMAPNKFESLGMVLKIILPFFIISFIYLLKRKKFLILGMMITFLTLANIRYHTPYLEYKSGFHLTVWVALFVFFAFYFYIELLKTTLNKVLKLILLIALFIFVIIGLLSIGLLLKRNDWKSDFERNYSQKVLFGEVIKSVKESEDTLFVIPDEWLLYYQAGIKNNNKMINFYGWMSLVWELNDPVVAKFKSDPPEFFYCDCAEEQVLLYSDRYKQMIRNGAKTPLWILDDKFENLTKDQKTKLRDNNFQLE